MLRDKLSHDTIQKKFVDDKIFEGNQEWFSMKPSDWTGASIKWSLWGVLFVLGPFGLPKKTDPMSGYVITQKDTTKSSVRMTLSVQMSRYRWFRVPPTLRLSHPSSVRMGICKWVLCWFYYNGRKWGLSGEEGTVSIRCRCYHMKDKELRLEEIETSHTLCWTGSRPLPQKRIGPLWIVTLFLSQRRKWGLRGSEEGTRCPCYWRQRAKDWGDWNPPH